MAAVPLAALTVSGIRKLSPRLRRALWGAVLTAGLGVLSWQTRVGGFLQDLSYDLITVAKPRRVAEGAVIIAMDDLSRTTLGQASNRWDRALHAGLLERLTDDQARAVVFDLVFTESGQPQENRDFVEAIRRSGKVVLAAKSGKTTRVGLQTTAPEPLKAEFVSAANEQWGLAEVWGNELEVKRLYYSWDGSSNIAPSLAWVAAKTAGMGLLEAPKTTPFLWLNYYGPSRTIDAIPYCQATDQPRGHYQGKIVFVGSTEQLPGSDGDRDRRPTPFTRLSGDLMSGVEIVATATMNLINSESLRPWPAWGELLLLFLCGLLFGAGFTLIRPAFAGVAGVVGTLVLAVLAVWMAAHYCTFFSWMNVAAVQVPVAFGWALHTHRKLPRVETETVGVSGSPGEASTVFQVFIAFKHHGSDGRPTVDSRIARELHEFLTLKGLRVFLSSVTLEKLGGDLWKREINEALESAKILVVVGSSPANIDSKWVRYEWDGFDSDITNKIKPDGRIFTVLEGVEPTDLPRPLRNRQAFANTPQGFEHLHRFIASALTSPQRPSATTEGVARAGIGQIPPADGESPAGASDSEKPDNQ